MKLLSLLLFSTLSCSCVAASLRASSSSTNDGEHLRRLLLQAPETYAAVNTRMNQDFLRRYLEDTHGSSRQRVLQPSNRNCGEQICTITTTEILDLANLFIEYMIPENFRDTVRAVVTPMVKHGLAVYKVCGSCVDLPSVESCSDDQYGHNATHSALVFLPLNETTDVPLAGKLRGYVYMHGTPLSVDKAPTEVWPGDLGEAVAAAIGELPNQAKLVELIVNTLEYWGVLLFASAGTVGLAPDYLGYGASLATHNRAYLVANTYRQDVVILFSTTKQFVSGLTGGCTLLEDTVTMSGTSEGGSAVIEGAVALRQLGVEVLQAFSAVGPIDFEQFIVFAFQSFDDGVVSNRTSPNPQNNVFFYNELPFLAFSYSIQIPGLTNTGSDESLVHPDWNVEGNFSRNILDWYDSPDPISIIEAMMLAPEYAPAVINADFLQLFQDARANNISSPCTSSLVTNLTDNNCQTLLENMPLNQFDVIDFNVSLCSSDYDTLVPPSSIPSSLFDYDFVSKFEIPGGGSVDHADAAFYCSFGPITFFATGPLDKPNLRTPLEGQELEVCLERMDMPTAVPTVGNNIPTAAPTTSGSFLISSRHGLAVVWLTLWFW